MTQGRLKAGLCGAALAVSSALPFYAAAQSSLPKASAVAHPIAGQNKVAGQPLAGKSNTVKKRVAKRVRIATQPIARTIDLDASGVPSSVVRVQLVRKQGGALQGVSASLIKGPAGERLLRTVVRNDAVAGSYGLQFLNSAGVPVSPAGLADAYGMQILSPKGGDSSVAAVVQGLLGSADAGAANSVGAGLPGSDAQPGQHSGKPSLEEAASHSGQSTMSDDGPVTSVATYEETTDSDGNTSIRSEVTTTNSDGSTMVDVSTATIDSDGHSTETQDVTVKDKDGNVVDSSHTTTQSDGTSTTVDRHTNNDGSVLTTTTTTGKDGTTRTSTTKTPPSNATPNPEGA